jgi:hypothetical protein
MAKDEEPIRPMTLGLASGWLAFTGRVSNPLDHYERFQIT